MNVLRDPDFRRLLGAHVVSQVGSGVTLLALPLIAALDLGATPFQVGLLAASETVPLLLLGLLAGVWADRRRRRPLMVATDLGRAVVLLAIPLAAWQGWLRFDLLVAVSVVAGTLSVVFDIAAQSYLPSLVPAAGLVQANSLMHSSYSVGGIAGPALAGVLIQTLRAPFAVAADALSFLVSGLLLGGIRRREPEPIAGGEARSIRADLGEGLRFVRDTPILRALGLSTGVWNLFDNMRQAMLVLFCARTLGMGPGLIGLVYAVASVGYLVGTFLPAPAARRLGLGRAVLLGALLVLPGDVLVALASGPPTVAAAMVGGGMFLSGLAGPVYDVNQFSLRQSITPRRMQGRVAATLRVLIRGTVPVGALLGGALAGVVGLRGVMWVGLLGVPLALLLVWLSPVPGVRVLPEMAEDAGSA